MIKTIEQLLIELVSPKEKEIINSFEYLKQQALKQLRSKYNDTKTTV